MSTQTATATAPAMPLPVWGPWDFTLSTEVVKIFDEGVTHPNFGVRYYRPMAYRTAHNGLGDTRYEFICAAERVILPPVLIYLAEVVINVEENGVPRFVSGHEIEPPVVTNLPGGWMNWQFPSAIPAPVLPGAKYVALASTSQVVEGVNYCLFCIQTLATRPPVVNAVLIYLYQAPGSSEPKITKVVPIR